MSRYLEAFRTCPASTFLWLGLLLGVASLTITPPFQAPDEQTHFYRAYQVSKGEMIGQRLGGQAGGFVPASLLKTVEQSRLHEVRFRRDQKVAIQDTLSLFSISLDRDHEVFVGFTNVVVSSPILYLPQVIGIGLGKLLDAPPILLMYLGRFSNLCVSVLLIFLAIRITPVLKHVFFLLALFPLALFQMSSLSADSFTNSISLVFIAFILRHAFSPRIIRKGDVIWFLLLFASIALAKAAYVPLLLLIVLIPSSKFVASKQYFLFIGLLMATGLLLASLWSLAAMGVYVPEEWNGGSPREQIDFIVSEPAKFVSTVLRDLFLRSYLGFTNQSGDLVFGNSYMGQMGILGWVDTPLPFWLMNSWWGLLLIVALIDRNDGVRIRIRDKLKIFTVLCLTVLSTLGLIYICCSPPGANYIIGQGRHLLPLLPLLFLLLQNEAIPALLGIYFQRVHQCLVGFVPVFSILSSFLTFVTLADRYYG